MLFLGALCASRLHIPHPSLHSALTRPYASLPPSLLQNLSPFTNAPPSRAVRMGQHVWLLLATVLTELLVIVKWSTGQYPAPFPKPVKVGLWTLGLGVVVVYPMYQVGCLSVCVCGRCGGRGSCARETGRSLWCRSLVSFPWLLAHPFRTALPWCCCPHFTSSLFLFGSALPAGTLSCFCFSSRPLSLTRAKRNTDPHTHAVWDPRSEEIRPPAEEEAATREGRVGARLYLLIRAGARLYDSI